MSSPSLICWQAWLDSQWSRQEGDTSRLTQIREAGLVREVCPTYAQMSSLWQYVYEDIVTWRHRVVVDGPQRLASWPIDGDIAAAFKDILMVLEDGPNALTDRFSRYASRPFTSPP